MNGRIATASLALLLVAGACTTSSTAKTSPTVFRMSLGEPLSIDPYNAVESEGILVARLLFKGLVDLDPKTGTIVSGLAEKWAKDDACKTWTFTVKQGTTFSNGEPVTADSFVAGMTRAVKQAAASDAASFLSEIVGFGDVHGTETAKATTGVLRGVVARDPSTLVITLDTADCDLVTRMLHPVFSPVPTSAGDAPNATFGVLPIGNGPFKMAGPWEHDKRIALVRNDAYAGPRPAIDRVEITIQTLDQEYKAFQAGDVDWARVPPELVAQARSTYEPSGGFLKQVTYGLTYLVVATNSAPLNNADARRAVSAAIDRRAIIDGVFKAPLEPATSIIPPVFKDYYTRGQCEACQFDLAKARAWAAAGGLTADTTITLSFNADGGNQAFVEAIADQLKTGLGVKVDVVSIAKFSDMLTAMQRKDGTGLYRMGWAADYPSPLDFLEPLLGTGGGANYSNYSSADFDQLLAGASAASSTAEKARSVAKAERLVLDQMALVPLWYNTEFRVFKHARWKGLAIDFWGNPTLASATSA